MRAERSNNFDGVLPKQLSLRGLEGNVMTNQEIFDTVAKHLLSQKAKSLGVDGEPAYRGVGDMKCAIGCLIPDARYYRSLEDQSVTSKNVLEAIGSHHLSMGGVMFLRDLQLIHDQGPVEKWAIDLAACARDHGLSARVVEEFLPWEPGE